eukprot:scaffold263672_cov18-Prasinocladus_malaysianus.AAC.1
MFCIGLACCFQRACQGILRVAYCLAHDALVGFGLSPLVLAGGHNLRVDGGYAAFVSQACSLHFTSNDALEELINYDPKPG